MLSDLKQLLLFRERLVPREVMVLVAKMAPVA